MVSELSCWTIYKKPKDYPNNFVVRRHRITPGHSEPTADFALFETLEDAREHIPDGCMNLGRFPEDDPVIAETWM